MSNKICFYRMYSTKYYDRNLLKNNNCNRAASGSDVSPGWLLFKEDKYRHVRTGILYAGTYFNLIKILKHTIIIFLVK